MEPHVDLKFNIAHTSLTLCQSQPDMEAFNLRKCQSNTWVLFTVCNCFENMPNYIFSTLSLLFCELMFGRVWEGLCENKLALRSCP